MAILQNKNINPVLALIANFCCFGILGYILIGQMKKALYIFLVSFICSVITFFVGGVGGMIVAIFGMIDVYQVADAIAKGEEIDENQYKFELLYKLMNLIDKSAVYKG